MNAKFLSHFTPSLMAPEALEAIFVQREKLAARLVEQIRGSALTPSKQYTLLIGPRGIGKTHLVSLVYHRIRTMDDLRERLLVAWLREEEWGVTSFLDLLLRIFRALLAEYSDAALAERVESLYELQPAEAERAAGTLLREYAGDRTLLVLVENLDDLFDGLGDEGQKRLRAYLQENPFWTILATAQSLFNGVSLQTSPFYGFFRIQHLGELDLEDATLLMTNIAHLEEDQELASFIQSPTGRARIRAVHHLAGGNPRVYVIFSQFVTRDSLDDLVDPFMRTLDDLTPYYQARMSWLSPQQRKIVEFLCDRRHAVPVKEIAQRCFMTHQTASSQLKDLREKGYVKSTSLGRDSYYELREPLMRMAMELKKQRGEPIRLIVDFLRLWYLPSELQRRLEILPSNAVLEREYLLQALLKAEQGVEDPRVAACRGDLAAALMDEGNYRKSRRIAEELIAIRGNADDWFDYAFILLILNEYGRALAAFDTSLEQDPSNQFVWLNRSAPLSYFNRHEEALKSLDRALELDPGMAYVWFMRSSSLCALGRYEEALASVEKAVGIKPNDALTWRQRAEILSHLGRYREAFESADKAIEIEPDQALFWVERARTLIHLGSRERALNDYSRAMALDPDLSRATTERAVLLCSMGRYAEAVSSLEGEIASDHVCSITVFKYAEALLALNRWDEGAAVLNGALYRFGTATDRNVGDSKAIVRNLLTSAHEPAERQPFVATLVTLYDKHQALRVLGEGVVRTIPLLVSATVSDETAQPWLKAWREAAGDRPELQLPLRLLDAAVRYRETGDPRILLELPAEERAILEPLLEGEESPGEIAGVANGDGNTGQSPTVRKEPKKARKKG